MIDEIKNLGLSVGRILIIAFAAICLLFVALAFLRVGLVYWVYTTVEDWVAIRLGFDYYISNLAATVFAGIFAALLPTLAWYLFLGKKQAWGVGTIAGVQLLMCATIYTVGSGVCFDRRTGEPLCYFADTQNGRVWSYTPGFEPTTGKKFRLYTREIKEAEDRRKPAPLPVSVPQPAPQSFVVPTPAPTVYENVPPPVHPAISVAPTPAPQKHSAPPPVTFQPAKETAVRTESYDDNRAFERELELERIRQAEETRRQQNLERERREAEELRIREAENNRLRAERERYEREQQSERERAALEDRERQIAAEREQQRRREEKERKRLETVNTIINIARPAIERLTRRKN